MEKSCGKSVACANSVRNFYRETRRFQVFATEQEGAALRPQRNAYGVKLKDAYATAAELLNRVALKPTNLPEGGNFLLIQLENVRMPGSVADVLLIVMLQLWLLIATMNAYLGGDRSVIWPAALASLVCLLLNAGLLWYVFRMERQR